MEDRMMEQLKRNLKEVTITAPAGLRAGILLRIGTAGRERGPLEPAMPFFRMLSHPAVAFGIVAVTVSAAWFYASDHRKPVEVSFKLYEPEAQSVRIAGDFNGWDTQAHELENHDGTWTTTVALMPGQYQYQYVVDDSRWIPDPANNESIASSFGGDNSFIEVND